MRKHDFSATSLALLKSQITQIFPEDEVWIPDADLNPPSGDGPLNLIMCGDFFRKFVAIEELPRSEVFLWGLGTPTLNFFTQLAHFDTSQISMIPRNILFPLGPSQKMKLHTGPVDLVYAGRLTASKHILTLVWMSFYLQKMVNPEIQLQLFGSFFQEEVLEPTSQIGTYQLKVEELIQKLDWTKKPILHGEVPPGIWPARSYQSPIYISLSTLPFEDFSVSIAQAQEVGMPIVATQWGAHLDVHGEKLLIPLRLMERIEETFESAERDGKIIADYLQRKETTHIPLPDQNLHSPKLITNKEWIKKRKHFLELWKLPLEDMLQHRTDRLASHPQWPVLMKEIISCFTSNWTG